MEERSDYRSILQKELNHRCESNPRYSLRAFARDLKLSPSRLSEILNSKQGLSRTAATEICKILGFGDKETQYFCDLVSMKHARSVKEKEDAKIRLIKQDYEKEAEHELQLDAFKIVSDWYHFGLIELLKVKDFRDDSKWIARRLGVPVIQIELAIERLKRVGLLKVENGKFVATHSNHWVPSSGIPSSSIRKFHRQILEKAIQAMELQPVQERYFATHLLSIDRTDLPEAFNAIQEFQQKFCARFESGTPKELLYCISMQCIKMIEEETV